MPRADLIALTDDGLIQLSNAGLVKRGLRELQAGTVPKISEDDGGLIVAEFTDGTTTRLPAGKGLAGASCTCPSSGFCRHRVMLALTYRAHGSGTGIEAPVQPREWDPAVLDTEAFEASLGFAAKAELRNLLATRLEVELERGRIPVARLPMSTVRFLVPSDISYARCDCVQSTACAHIGIALRAFREAGGARRVVIGADLTSAPPGEFEPLAKAAESVVARLLDVGVTAGPGAHSQAIDLARRAATAAGAVQMLLCLDALSEQIEAYAGRSARYDEVEALRLATELLARTRASDRAMALGLGDPLETQMSKVRFVSLGTRLWQEGSDIRAALMLADSDTGAVTMLERLFRPMSGDAAPLAGTILRRLLGPGVSLAGAGKGQLLTSVAKRRADGLLTLGSSAGGKTQVMPRDATFAFQSPLLVTRLDTVSRRLDDWPISLIRPRQRIHDVHVFPVGEVVGQAWSAGSQVWQGAVNLPDSAGTLYLERRFDAGAPGALDCLAAGFDGRFGRLRQITGPVRRDGGVLICEPWSLGADGFVVPDLEEAANAAMPQATRAPDPSVVEQACLMLAGAVHAGRRARVGNASSETKLATQLSAEGYQMFSTRMQDWTEADPGDAATFAHASFWCHALSDVGGY